MEKHDYQSGSVKPTGASALWGRPYLFWIPAAACLLTQPLRAQLQYPPGLFDIDISFGCNCACDCGNTNAAASPIGAFLAANPVTQVAGTTAMPLAGQVVPPHYTLFPPAPFTPPYAGNGSYPFYLEGWTVTQSKIFATGQLNPNPKPVAGFEFCQPLSFKIPFRYYEDLLPGLTGHSPGEQPQPALQTSNPQPYPWDVNVTLTLQNKQVYNLEQQLAIGYFPREGAPPELESPVKYRETNGLLTITLLCTNGNLVDISSATITATLDNVNIPPPLNESIGGTITGNLFTNWGWPLTIDDLATSGTIPGSAGTIQASLPISISFPSTATINGTGLLVRADRAYALTVTYSVIGYIGNTPYVVNMPAITVHTGLIPPCTNTPILIVTDLCTGTPQLPTSPCYGTITGLIDMLGVQTPASFVNIRAFNGPAGNGASQNLALSDLPGPFNLTVVGSDAFGGNVPYHMQGAMELSTFADYEYFTSPVLYPVYVPCGQTIDRANDFVMCPVNPGIVQGTISLNGPVDPSYYGGVPALSTLQFANYDGNGLPHDPLSGLADSTLQNNNFGSQFLSYVKATNGASAGPPFLSTGGGSGLTEFENPLVFQSATSFVGDYKLRLAGLQGQNSFWDINDLHLVFGSPVNLVYDIHETNPQFTNQVIVCGATLTRNFSHCFGLYTAKVINQYPDLETYNYATITVSGTGPGYSVGPFTISQFAFQTQTAVQNEADIPLFLPEGNYQYSATVYNGNGALVLGDTTYFSIVCTNPCLVVDCVTNKTLPCYATNFFDVPTAYSCCGDVVITEVNTVVTSPRPCETVATRTWRITDSCHNTNYCVQTVTLTNVPPTIVCASNKTLSCISNLVFDLPTVISPCCGTNYAVAVYGSDVTLSITNAPGTNVGPCSTLTTRTWLITDCCGNSNLCRQTITLTTPTTYTLTLQPGFNLIANQLNNPAGNTADVLFPNPFGQRDGDTLSKFTCSDETWTMSIFDSLSPSGFSDQSGGPVPAPTLAPGEGAFYNNQSGAPQTITFTGNPVCPEYPGPLPCPCDRPNLASRKLDCLGTYENITGLSPQEGVQLFRWNGSGYTSYTYNSGAWSPGTPIMNVGEAVFITVPCPCLQPFCMPTVLTNFTAATGPQGVDVTSGVSVQIATTQPPSDSANYLLADDLSGPSAIYVAGMAGDYLCTNGCYSLCYDFRVFNDGTSATPPSSAPLNIHPSFKLVSDTTAGFLVAQWLGNTTVTEDGGRSPGWHRLCAPIAQLNSNGTLPSNANGVWKMLTGANSDWNTLLSQVTAVELNFDYTASQYEEVGYANFCLTTNACECLQIACPNDIVVSSCTATQLFYTPLVTSCCSNAAVTCNPASGYFFLPGTVTTVQCTATNSCQQVADCTFTVTVQCTTNNVVRAGVSNSVFVLNGAFTPGWSVQGSTDLLHWIRLPAPTSPPPYFINMSNMPAQYFRLLYETTY